MNRCLLAMFIAVGVFPMNAGAATARAEPLSWHPARVESVYAWRTDKRNVTFAAALELPNACYRAKVKRQPTFPNSPLVYTVVWGQIAGTMCAQMIVVCAVADAPRFTAKNFVVVNDRIGTKKLPIQTARPRLPKACPS